MLPSVQRAGQIVLAVCSPRNPWQGLGFAVHGPAAGERRFGGWGKAGPTGQRCLGAFPSPRIFDRSCYLRTVA